MTDAYSDLCLVPEQGPQNFEVELYLFGRWARAYCQLTSGEAECMRAYCADHGDVARIVRIK